jgi:hypothetical protein
MAANANFGRAARTRLLAASAIAFVVLSPSPLLAQAHLTLPQVRASLEREGPAATVKRLTQARQWDAVLDSMGQGRAAWIAIAPLLAKGADAGAAEGLGIALAAGLPRAPAAVLDVLDPSDGPVLGVSRVCHAPFIEPKPGAVARYKPRALAAVRAVHVARLSSARDACLRALQTL